MKLKRYHVKQIDHKSLEKHFGIFKVIHEKNQSFKKINSKANSLW